MKKLLTTFLIAIPCSLLLTRASANAAIAKTATPAIVHYGYSAFGNQGNNAEGDCTIVADANLVEYAFPDTPITTAEVEAIYQDGWQFGLRPETYEQEYGFGGHTISSYHRDTTQAQIKSDANAGGVYADLDLEDVGYADHAVAVIGANAKGPQLVWYGIPTRWTWAKFWSLYVDAYGYSW